MSEVPRRALKFTMNGAFKAQLSATFPLPRSRAADVALAACAGAAAGGSETLVHTPFEVVKIRVQAGGGSGSVPSTALGIVRAEGVRGLYAGLGAYALRQMVWNGGFFGMLGLGNTILVGSDHWRQQGGPRLLAGAHLGQRGDGLQQPARRGQVPHPGWRRLQSWCRCLWRGGQKIEVDGWSSAGHSRQRGSARLVQGAARETVPFRAWPRAAVHGLRALPGGGQVPGGQGERGYGSLRRAPGAEPLPRGRAELRKAGASRAA
ncbi:unnamed protein product [Prorocentrum cordatum]|uniref:ADP,ATP carrier protein n=1 Tax=Prorocentrum cordatum TaxID=2364126 RepID=A0ABN9RLX8_9DINO|nr:unnamed protein product [Polarella glacialis]